MPDLCVIHMSLPDDCELLKHFQVCMHVVALDYASLV